MRFQFTPPSTTQAEKVRLSLSPELLSWADGLASSSGSSREIVLEQAVGFAFESANRPARTKNRAKGLGLANGTSRS